jgi:hypothetical protein
MIKNLPVCALIQGFGQLGLHFPADKIRILEERRIEIWDNCGRTSQPWQLGQRGQGGTGYPEKPVLTGDGLLDGGKIGTKQKGCGLSDP